MRAPHRWCLLALLFAAAPSAHATRLRVVAATELQIDPRVAPTGDVSVSVRARDDHSVPVRGHVRLTVDAAGRRLSSLEGETGADGIVTFDLPLEHGEREFHVAAELVGGANTASARTEADVDLTLPFVTVELRVPPTIDIVSHELEADVTIHVGEVVPANPSGWPVALYVDNAPTPRVAEVDDTGFHAFRIPLGELGPPGVVTLHAVYARHGGSEVRSPDRRVVLRAATHMTLTRVPGEGNRIVGTLDSAVGPVVHAPVRVAWGARTIGAALTDDRGIFTLDVDPDVSSQPGVMVQAVFEPSEPWFLPSQSAPLVLTAPEARRISWRWALVPVGAAILLLSALWFRRRGETPGRVSIVPVPSLGDVNVERIADVRSQRVRIVLVAEDRATQRPVKQAKVTWTMPALAEKPGDEPIEVAGGARFECVVRAEGYAPRTLSGELPRGGEYRVHVPLRSWREELFERARTWMRRAGAMGAPAMPTPREVLESRTEDDRSGALVSLIEEGTYGPTPPDPETIARADALAHDLDPRRQRER